jgi:hypothetical protein
MYIAETREAYTPDNSLLRLNSNVVHATEDTEFWSESRLNVIDPMPNNDNTAKLHIYCAPKRLCR